jgi:hypothetical protein
MTSGWPVSQRDRRSLDPVSHPELRVDPLEVLFHGPPAESQLRGDLLALQAARCEGEHLGLTGGEPERPQVLGGGVSIAGCEYQDEELRVSGREGPDAESAVAEDQGASQLGRAQGLQFQKLRDLTLGTGEFAV